MLCFISLCRSLASADSTLICSRRLRRSAIDHHRHSTDTGQCEIGRVFSLGGGGKKMNVTSCPCWAAQHQQRHRLKGSEWSSRAGDCHQTPRDSPLLGTPLPWRIGKRWFEIPIHHYLVYTSSLCELLERLKSLLGGLDSWV